MNGKVLLDTNAVIAVFGSDPGILALVSAAVECFLPSVVVGELLYGAYRSLKVDDNLKRIESFCNTLTVLACDRSTAREYGRIKSELRIKGRAIPENDIWIAAIAAQHQLALVSRDEHFDQVAGLIRQRW